MKIAVLGAGAIGSWLGGKLAQSGQNVTLLTTNQAHKDAINQRGLTLRENETESVVQLPAESPREFSTPVDLMLLVTKSFQSRQALQDAHQAINQSTVLMSVQNGLGNIETMADFVGDSQIIASTTMMPIDKTAPGVVESKGDGPTYFGFPRDEKADTAHVEQAFANSGLDLQPVDNILQRIWTKVAFNVGMNAVCALTRGTPGTIGNSPEATLIVQRAAEEAVAVAATENITLDVQSIFDTIAYACREHGDHKASMLQDLLAQRQTEVDALNGAIVERAAKADVEVPVNQMLMSLVRLAQDSYRQE